MQDEDIKLQGVSLRELLTKYFVAPQLGLLAADYWAEYQGFKMILNVSSLCTIPEIGRGASGHEMAYILVAAAYSTVHDK